MRQVSLNMGVLHLTTTSLSVINMDAQIKNETIAEITATAIKTIEQTVRES